MRLTVLGVLGLLAVGAVPSALAQTVYRIVEPDGRVTFSDRPPLTSTKPAATLNLGKTAAATEGSALPFELRQVATRFAVTLHTATDCQPCNAGRALLVGRGIPFTEKTVSTAEDSQALQRISGENTVPLLLIGSQLVKGFSPAQWTQFLDAAGYPKSSRLPVGYRQPPPAPLAPLAPLAPSSAASSPSAPDKESVAATDAASAKPDAAPSLPPTPAEPKANPAGIQF